MASEEQIPESAKARHYKELLVWQRSLHLAKLVYQLTERFPMDERFGLTASMRRAAVAIPASIAKGQARYETREFIQQLHYAEGYLAELETELLLSVQLGFCGEIHIEELLKELGELQRMTWAIGRKLRSS